MNKSKSILQNAVLSHESRGHVVASCSLSCAPRGKPEFVEVETAPRAVAIGGCDSDRSLARLLLGSRPSFPLLLEEVGVG